MNLRDLRHFLAIAQAGRIGSAANQLCMTQPALTKSLKRLEASAGGPLFERTRKGLALTQAGQVLLARASKILVEMEDINRELHDIGSGESGTLSVGAGPTMMEYLIPRAVEGLLQVAPRVKLEITTALNDTLFRQLRTGRLDLAVSALPEVTPPDLSQAVLMHDEMVVVASRTHPLARKASVGMADLVSERWILSPPEVVARRWLETQFAKEGLPSPTVCVQADSTVAIMALLANSRLVGFQPRLNISALRVADRIRPIRAPALAWRRPIGISLLSDRYLPPVAHRFIELLRAQAGKLESTLSLSPRRNAGP